MIKNENLKYLKENKLITENEHKILLQNVRCNKLSANLATELITRLFKMVESMDIEINDLKSKLKKNTK